MENVDASAVSRIVPPFVNVKTVGIHMQLTHRRKKMIMSLTVKVMKNLDPMRKEILSLLMMTWTWIKALY